MVGSVLLLVIHHLYCVRSIEWPRLTCCCTYTHNTIRGKSWWIHSSIPNVHLQYTCTVCMCVPHTSTCLCKYMFMQVHYMYMYNVFIHTCTCVWDFLVDGERQGINYIIVIEWLHVCSPNWIWFYLKFSFLKRQNLLLRNFSIKYHVQIHQYN